MANNNLHTPHLVDTEWSKQLIVKGKPFLIRGGELQNSSLTSAEYMNTVWQQMVDTNVNTLLGCVTWEDIEPEEDRFDFAELDSVIEGARKHSLHLILLWFGSFKNGAWAVRVSLAESATYTTCPQVFPRTPPDGSRRMQGASLAPS